MNNSETLWTCQWVWEIQIFFARKRITQLYGDLDSNTEDFPLHCDPMKINMPAWEVPKKSLNIAEWVTLR